MLKVHFNYLIYLIKHKWFVFRACLWTNVPLWRILVHDWSKFTPAEWVPYANYFFNTKLSGSKKIYWKHRFALAWNHHQKTNPHHWEYWVIPTKKGPDTLEMPETYVREMVADWCGAGRAKTGTWDIKKWYELNKEIILLHPHSRVLAENLINHNIPILTIN